MISVPGRGSDEDTDEPRGGINVDPIATCNCQDGTLFVYEDHAYIERSKRSKFDDRTIPMDEVRDVTYAGGLVIKYIQIHQSGVENDEGGFLRSPVDVNTLHFGRGVRDRAQEAKDAILEHAGG